MDAEENEVGDVDFRFEFYDTKGVIKEVIGENVVLFDEASKREIYSRLAGGSKPFYAKLPSDADLPSDAAKLSKFKGKILSF